MDNSFRLYLSNSELYDDAECFRYVDFEDILLSSNENDLLDEFMLEDE